MHTVDVKSVSTCRSVKVAHAAFPPAVVPPPEGNGGLAARRVAFTARIFSAARPMSSADGASPSMGSKRVQVVVMGRCESRRQWK
jgi:hypothetical protein